MDVNGGEDMKWASVWLALGVLFSVGVRCAVGQSYFVKDLGALGSNEVSQGNAANNLGHSVGMGTYLSIAKPFVHDGFQIMNLGTLGGSSGEALDINDFDIVVGHAQIQSGQYHPFLFQN